MYARPLPPRRTRAARVAATFATATLASFFAAARRPQRARATQALNDAEMTDSTMRRIREPERHATAAAVAMAEGRYADAVRELRRADTTYDGPNGSCAICVLDDVGWAWATAGAADSAIHYWVSFPTRRSTAARTSTARSDG